jgi:hypothetical protein
MGDQGRTVEGSGDESEELLSQPDQQMITGSH